MAILLWNLFMTSPPVLSLLEAVLIFVSALQEKSWRERLLREGGKTVLQKPCQTRRLKSKISKKKIIIGKQFRLKGPSRASASSLLKIQTLHYSFFTFSFVRSFVRLFRKENYFDFLLLVKFCRASKYDNFEFFPKSSKSLNLIYFYVSLRQQEQSRRRNLQYSLSYESARACNQFIYKLLY